MSKNDYYDYYIALQKVRETEPQTVAAIRDQTCASQGFTLLSPE